jgi:5'-methylthioadenosine phosphorylase
MLAQLGGDVIGFTNATECIMAREAGMCFAAFAGVVNLGAGLSDGEMKAEHWRDARKVHGLHFTEIVAELVRTFMLEDSDTHATCRCATAAPIEK